ncbi:hotdog fold thioesterase [Cyclobacterium jeungdonense]|uniref:Hotdog fold thioesterase n=1 Tax=Cyclobacterium jeungdonense TaxID=708087 RepID=A0ABT8CBW2_9BACT|nr:hotdog fold thioesterase [Cyclobacterium jeungdonense]MDN3689298.1 hotdog fold thioesterase [Cyclobacterium jeungdonense]
MLFKKKPDLDFLNQMGKDNMTGFLGITYTAAGDDFLEAEMPVEAKTKQPFGLLHGGANMVLAESLGSVAALLTLDEEGAYPVGLEINANHLKSVKGGKVTGRVSPLHIGKRTQVWEIKIKDQDNNLTCISRITLAIIRK